MVTKTICESILVNKVLNFPSHENLVNKDLFLQTVNMHSHTMSHVSNTLEGIIKYFVKLAIMKSQHHSIFVTRKLQMLNDLEVCHSLNDHFS